MNEPLPGLVPFPRVHGIQDVVGFRIMPVETKSRRSEEGASMTCSAGVWECTESKWQLNPYEREYCRVVSGEVTIGDRHGRRWTFAADSAFLLLRGFRGHLEVVHPARIVFVVFSLPDTGALDWCMTAEGRTALGRDRIEN
jgi:uncharacterized cupin superfamily protein